MVEYTLKCSRVASMGAKFQKDFGEVCPQTPLAAVRRRPKLGPVNNTWLVLHKIY